MTARQIAIRIGLDGKAEIQRDMGDIEATGDKTFATVGKSADKATSAVARQKEAFDQLVAAQKNADTQKANQIAFNQVMGVDPARGAGSAKASADVFAQHYAGMEARAAALRAQVDPLAAAQSRYNAELTETEALLKAELITEDQLAAKRAMAATQLQQSQKMLLNQAFASAGFRNAGTAGANGRLSSFAMTNLGFQANDIISGLAMGQAPLQVLAQQGGQIYQVFAGEGVSVKTALGQVGSAAARVGASIGAFLISPMGLAAVAATALGTAAYLGFSRAAEAAKQFTDATQFAGRATGLTRDQFEALAEAGARAGNISVNTARGIEAAYSKTGMVGQQSLSSLIALTHEFAVKTDGDMDAAREALTKAFADPQKAGEQLLAGLGALDDKTRELIDTLMAQNQVTQAQEVLQAALTKALKDATDQTTWYGNAWQWVKDQASGAVDALGKLATAQPLVIRKAQLQNELELARRGQGVPAFDPESHSTRTSSIPRPIGDILADIARVDAAIDASVKKAKDGAADAAATRLSNLASPLVRNAIPGYGDLKTLTAGKAVVDQLNANKLALDKSGVSARDAADAQDAYTRAVKTYLDPAAKAAALTKLEADARNANTPAQKQAIAERRAAIELSGKVISTALADAQVHQAGAKAYSDAQRAVDKHTTSLQANLSAQLAVADAYLKGSAAGAQAEEDRQKIAQQVGQAAIGGAKQVAQLRDETAARRSLNDQVAAGAMTSEQAAREMSLQSALAPLQVARALAEGKAKTELGKIIAALTKARHADNAEVDRSRAQDEAEASERNLTFLRQELAIANDNAAVRQVELAVLEEKQRLLGQNIDAESKEGQQLVANAQAAAKLNQQLDLARASRAEVENTFDSIASQFQSFITEGEYDWKAFANFGLSALKEIEGEMFKLAAINPLKNLLFGSNLPTMSSVGGILGGLFGGIFGGGGSVIAGGLGISDLSYAAPVIAGVLHRGGMAGAANENRAFPADVVRFAPRYHGGADLSGKLKPDEVLSVLQRGERVLNREETRAYHGRVAAGGGMVYAPSFDLRGAVMTADLLRQMNAMAENAKADAIRTSRSSQSAWQVQQSYEHG